MCLVEGAKQNARSIIQPRRVRDKRRTAPLPSCEYPRAFLPNPGAALPLITG
jgi:hypothetical protein